MLLRQTGFSASLLHRLIKLIKPSFKSQAWECNPFKKPARLGWEEKNMVASELKGARALLTLWSAWEMDTPSPSAPPGTCCCQHWAGNNALGKHIDVVSSTSAAGRMLTCSCVNPSASTWHGNPFPCHLYYMKVKVLLQPAQHKIGDCPSWRKRRWLECHLLLAEAAIGWARWDLTPFHAAQPWKNPPWEP